MLLLLQVGLVHRDVRDSNFTCDFKKEEYFLLDLELCGPSGLPTFIASHWDTRNTLVEGRYTPQSDIYDFGLLLNKWAAPCVTSPEGQSFLQLLLTPACDQALSADELLAAADPWFKSLGL